MTTGPTSLPTGGPGASWFDRLCGWVYDRARGRYLDVVLTVNTAWIVLMVVPVNVATADLFFDPGRDEIREFFVACEITILAATPGVFLIIRRRHADLVSWLRGDPGADAAAAWVSAVMKLPRTIVTAALWYYVCILPAIVLASNRIGYPYTVTIGWSGGLALWVASVALMDYLLFERALRPAVRATWSELPRDFVVPPGGPSLRAKLLAVLLLLSAFSATFVAVATMRSTDSLSLAGQLAVGVGTSVAFTGTLALIVSLLVRNSLLTRIEALRQATWAIDRGEFGDYVPLMGGDELDELGHSFNLMVDRLRHHDDEIRDSRARIVAASDAARRQVERDLHDGAQQQLVTLRLRLAMARQAVDSDSDAAVLLDQARDDLGRALEELRDLAHGIYPAVLNTDGLPAALEVAAERSPLPVSVESVPDLRLEPEVEAAVYFCCVEALQNASKHAGPDARVQVRLDHGSGGFRFEIRDDGTGFAGTNGKDSSGLQNMADRMGALGGTLEIVSRPGGGTSVVGTLASGRTLTPETGVPR